MSCKCPLLVAKDGNYELKSISVEKLFLVIFSKTGHWQLGRNSVHIYRQLSELLTSDSQKSRASFPKSSLHWLSLINNSDNC